MKMTGAAHGTGTDEIIYSTIIKIDEELIRNNNGMAKEMECASVAAAAQLHGIEFFPILDLCIMNLVIDIGNTLVKYAVFENGKIKDHKDSFSLWKWARMALGASGLFLGWSGAVQGKIRKEAQGGLKLWMKRKRILNSYW